MIIEQQRLPQARAQLLVGRKHGVVLRNAIGSKAHFMSVSDEGFIAQRSATRIMRRRLRPSSLGDRLRLRCGKNMRYAAVHLLRNSDTGLTTRCCCSREGPCGRVVLRRAAATMSTTSPSSPDDCNLPPLCCHPVASCVELGPTAQRVALRAACLRAQLGWGRAGSRQLCAGRTCEA